jgi:hypothetical protein
MARHLRFEQAAAVYHVAARGTTARRSFTARRSAATCALRSDMLERYEVRFTFAVKSAARPCGRSGMGWGFKSSAVCLAAQRVRQRLATDTGLRERLSAAKTEIIKISKT